MFIIFIKGRANATNSDGTAVDPEHLKKLNGVTYEQGAFTEFLADGVDSILARKIKRDGGMYFSCKAADNSISVTTTYWSKRSLTDKELESLAHYTAVQWCDGIGEGFETESPERFGFTVSCQLDSPKIEVVEDD